MLGSNARKPSMFDLEGMVAQINDWTKAGAPMSAAGVPGTTPGYKPRRMFAAGPMIAPPTSDQVASPPDQLTAVSAPQERPLLPPNGIVAGDKPPMDLGDFTLPRVPMGEIDPQQPQKVGSGGFFAKDGAWRDVVGTVADALSAAGGGQPGSLPLSPLPWLR